jgi:putative transposase
MVLAMINTVFAQDTQEASIAQWRTVADQLRAKFPKLSGLMNKSEADVLAFLSFPKAHRTQIHGSVRNFVCEPVNELTRSTRIDRRTG